MSNSETSTAVSGADVAASPHRQASETDSPPDEQSPETAFGDRGAAVPLGFRTLQAGFLSATLSSVLIIIVAFFTYLEISQYRRASAQIDRKLTEMLDTGSILLADATSRRDAERMLLILAPILGDPDILGISVKLRDGTLLAEHGLPIGEFAAAHIRRRPITHPIDGEPATIGTILVGLSHERIDDEFNERLLRHVLLAALILAAIVFTTHQSLRLTVMQPMRRLLSSIKSWQAEGRHSPVSWTRNDEFGQLIYAFNQMQHQQQFYHRNLRAARDTAEAGDRAKTAFLAIISHELRTPLNAIIGFSDLLKQTSPNPASSRQAEYLDHIGDSGRHLLNLVNDILDVTHAHAGELNLEEAEIQLRPLIDDIIKVSMKIAGPGAASVTNAVPGELPMILGDHARLGRAIGHLLSNAITATPPDGTVQVSAAVDDDGLCICIRDTGDGIPPEKFAQLMQPFNTGDVNWQNHSEGAGLGLTYARALAQRHGGSFRIESEPGAGTTAIFRLPPDRFMPA